MRIKFAEKFANIAELKSEERGCGACYSTLKRSPDLEASVLKSRHSIISNSKHGEFCKTIVLSQTGVKAHFATVHQLRASKCASIFVVNTFDGLLDASERFDVCEKSRPEWKIKKKRKAELGRGPTQEDPKKQKGSDVLDRFLLKGQGSVAPVNKKLLSLMDGKLDELIKLNKKILDGGRPFRASTADPSQTSLMESKTDDVVERLFPEFKSQCNEDDRLSASTRSKSSIERVFVLHVVQDHNGFDQLVISCNRCLRALTQTKMGEGGKKTKHRTNMSRQLNKSAGNSRILNSGVVCSQERKMSELKTELRQLYIQKTLNSKWDAGILITQQQYKALTGEVRGTESAKFRDKFLQRYCKTHLASKDHDDALRIDLEVHLLKARGREVIGSQLDIAHAGVMMGNSGKDYFRMCLMAHRLGVDVGDYCIGANHADAMARTNRMTTAVRIQNSICLRDVHPRTGCITAFANALDLGTPKRQPRWFHLLLKRIGRNRRYMLVGAPLKYSGDEIDEEAGYELQGEQAVYNLSRTFMLTSEYLDTYYKGSMTDGALSKPTTFLNGLQAGFNNLGCDIDLKRNRQLRLDVMHKMNSVLRHVRAGVQCQCVRSMSKVDIDFMRSWHKTVLMKITKHLNAHSRGGKDESKVAREAISAGVMFFVGKTMSNTRLDPFLRSLMETAIINYPLLANTVDFEDPDSSLAFSKYGVMSLLLMFGVYSSVLCIFFVGQDLDMPSNSHLAPTRKLLHHIDGIISVHSLQELMQCPLFTVAQKHRTDIEAGRFQGASLEGGDGVRTWMEEKKVISEVLTEGSTLRYVKIFCMALSVELKSFFMEKDVQDSCWLAVHEASERLFFKSAVHLATGKRRMMEGKAHWDHMVSRRGDGLTRDNLKILFEKGLYSKPPSLADYDERSFDVDVMAFRKQVVKMISGIDSAKRPLFWVKRWFDVRKVDDQSSVLKVKLGRIDLDETSHFLVAMDSVDELEAPPDCWSHYVLTIASVENITDERKFETVLRLDRMIPDFFDPELPQNANKTFLAAFDIIDTASLCLESIAEPAVGIADKVVGKNRPYKELSQNSSLRGRIELAIGAPPVEDSKAILDFGTDLWINGDKSLKLPPLPLPISSNQKSPGVPPSMLEALGSKKKKHHLAKCKSINEARSWTKKMATEYETFLQSNACKVDPDKKVWKEAYQNVNDRAEGANDDEKEDLMSAQEQQHPDPLFRYAITNAFVSTRSKRTVFLQGMYANSGSHLPRNRFQN